MRTNLRAWLKMLLLLSDEAVVLFVVLFVLWKLGVHFSIWSLAAIAGVAAVIIFLLHRILWPVLTDRQTDRPNGMVGLEGEVVTPLVPDGVVRVQGVLWKARCRDAGAGVGQSVRVVGLEGLKLMVETRGEGRDHEPDRP